MVYSPDLEDVWLALKVQGEAPKAFPDQPGQSSTRIRQTGGLEILEDGFWVHKAEATPRGKQV